MPTTAVTFVADTLQEIEGPGVDRVAVNLASGNIFLVDVRHSPKRVSLGRMPGAVYALPDVIGLDAGPTNRITRLNVHRSRAPSSAELLVGDRRSLASCFTSSGPHRSFSQGRFRGMA